MRSAGTAGGGDEGRVATGGGNPDDVVNGRGEFGLDLGWDGRAEGDDALARLWKFARKVRSAILARRLPQIRCLPMMTTTKRSHVRVGS